MFSSNQVFRKRGVPGNQVFAVKIVLILVGNIRRKRVFCTKIKQDNEVVACATVSS